MHTRFPPLSIATLVAQLQSLTTAQSITDALEEWLRGCEDVTAVRCAHATRQAVAGVTIDGQSMTFRVDVGFTSSVLVTLTLGPDASPPTSEDVVHLGLVQGIVMLALQRATETERRTDQVAQAGALHQLMERVAAATSASEVAQSGVEVIVSALGWDAGVVLGAEPTGVLGHAFREGQDQALSEEVLGELTRLGNGLHGQLVGEALPGDLPHAVVWPLHEEDTLRMILLGRAPRGVADGFGAVLTPIAQLSSVLRGGLERVEQMQRELRAIELERASAAKSEFLSRMSHELRTPLNAVLGFSQLLETDELGEDAADSVAHIRHAGEHLLKLVEEVLDIARIEAGRMSLSMEPLPLREVLAECGSLVRTLADDRALILTVPPPGAAEIWVSADRQRVVQIVLNLLSNAVKYNRTGGRIDVGLASLPDGGVTLRVADTGTGIAAQDMERLFEPFDRLDADRSHTPGTGLGLAVSRRLAEAMGGTLVAESVMGSGTTFMLTLAGADPGDLAATAAVTDSVSDTGTTGTVLYVEDNWPNVKLVERILSRRPGVRFLHASDGAEGLDLACREHPDLILLDLDLPVMHGTEVLAGLRRSDEASDIPVVVVTADPSEEMGRTVLALGARERIAKPMDVNHLLAVIDHHLGDHL